MTERTINLADITYSNSFAGVRITESAHAVERTEDWSQVRSPGRARRRLKQGHQQRIVTKYIPCAFTLANGDMVMHPALAGKLRQEIGEQMRKKADQILLDAIYGRR